MQWTIYLIFFFVHIRKRNLERFLFRKGIILNKSGGIFQFIKFWGARAKLGDGAEPGGGRVVGWQYFIEKRMSRAEVISLKTAALGSLAAPKTTNPGNNETTISLCFSCFKAHSREKKNFERQFKIQYPLVKNINGTRIDIFIIRINILGEKNCFWIFQIVSSVNVNIACLTLYCIPYNFDYANLRRMSQYSIVY